MQSKESTFPRGGLKRTSAIILIFCLLLIPARSWSSATGKIDLNEHYSQAKEFYARISSDQDLSEDRKNWLEAIGKFRQIYKTDQNHQLSPSSLFMMARIYHDMFEKYNNPLDLGESIAYYEDIVSLYAKNRLADDALYAIGNIYLNDRKELKKAERFFKRLLTNYPDGDMAIAAAAQCEKLSGPSGENGSSTVIVAENIKNKVTGSSSAPKSIPAGSRADLKPLRYWSTVNYTRVVIETTSPVKFKENLLEKMGDQPRRLYVDLQDCQIAPDLQREIPIDDGLLRRVRSGQYSADSVRVVLDTQSLSDYKIFSLEDPFRIVIDVKGQKNEAAVATVGKEEIPTLAQQLGLGIKRIILDPGHGGKDPGARGFGLNEKDVVLTVARKLAARLKRELGCDVILTRDMDVFIPLEERTAIANTKGGDLFISIHANASPSRRVRGVETYILDLAKSNNAMQVAARENSTSTKQISDLQTILIDLIQNSKKTESIKLAELVQESIVSGLKKSHKNVRNLGVKEAPFIVLVGAQMPAILAEISFISNPTEAKLLKTDKYLNTISDQITAGVSQYVTDLNLTNLAFMQ